MLKEAGGITVGCRIEVREVSYWYGTGPARTESGSGRAHATEAAALSDMNLVIEPGEWLAVVGANGSGKSTLAHHLNGSLLPGAGEVRIDGVSTLDASRRRWIRQRVGMVFQNPGSQLVASHLEDDVAFGPENLGIPHEQLRVRVEQALKAVDLWDVRQRPTESLSGGQQQCAAIAGVLAMQPRALVLDEPTSMLDPEGRKQVVDVVQQLYRKRGMTVVYVTHDLEEAVLADRVAVLDHGQLIRTGPPHSILTDQALLEAVGLRASAVTRLAAGLRERGVPLPATVAAVDGLVDALCRLK